MGAVDASYTAGLMGTFGGYERRQDEWVHQSKLALAELKQIGKQILAAQIRKDIADRELASHQQQIENAKSVDDFLRDKFTSRELYRWTTSQIAEVYFRTYQLALDQARRAERAYQQELAAASDFVQASHWDTLKRGLCAGEHLHHDLKRMESAYLERNLRELEITKHISLQQLDRLIDVRWAAVWKASVACLVFAPAVPSSVRGGIGLPSSPTSPAVRKRFSNACSVLTSSPATGCNSAFRRSIVFILVTTCAMIPLIL
jgi:hypothetical protein